MDLGAEGTKHVAAMTSAGDVLAEAKVVQRRASDVAKLLCAATAERGSSPERDEGMADHWALSLRDWRIEQPVLVGYIPAGTQMGKEALPGSALQRRDPRTRMFAAIRLYEDCIPRKRHRLLAKRRMVSAHHLVIRAARASLLLTESGSFGKALGARCAR
jgi:hypothetical protein